MKDVASGKESEPGILTLNDEHVRFKAAPNESGDGYSMITYLDQISRLPGPRCLSLLACPCEVRMVLAH